MLAIAAARLGFSPVLALDHDPAAAEATEENARRNGVEVDARLADVLAEPAPATDVAVANIALEAIPQLPLRASLVVTSGYLAADEIALPAYRHVERRTREGWAADLFRSH